MHWHKRDLLSKSEREGNQRETATIEKVNIEQGIKEENKNDFCYIITMQLNVMMLRDRDLSSLLFCECVLVGVFVRSILLNVASAHTQMAAHLLLILALSPRYLQ
jgi:hypothetical protein